MQSGQFKSDKSQRTLVNVILVSGAVLGGTRLLALHTLGSVLDKIHDDSGENEFKILEYLIFKGKRQATRDVADLNNHPIGPDPAQPLANDPR